MGIIEEILAKVNAQGLLIQQIIAILNALPTTDELALLNTVSANLDASTQALQDALDNHST